MIVLLTFLLLFSACSENKDNKNIYLEPGVKIYIAENEKAPVKLAANILLRDLKNVLGKESVIVHSINDIKDTPAIVILNNTTKNAFFKAKNIQGEEAYGIYTDKDFVILNGSDMRGTIYAIYAFSERFLNIPPLWFWASWEPDKKEKIEIKANTNIISSSPYVKFRAWFPDDMNMFGPWRELSEPAPAVLIKVRRTILFFILFISNQDLLKKNISFLFFHRNYNNEINSDI